MKLIGHNYLAVYTGRSKDESFLYDGLYKERHTPIYDDYYECALCKTRIDIKDFKTDMVGECEA